MGLLYLMALSFELDTSRIYVELCSKARQLLKFVLKVKET